MAELQFANTFLAQLDALPTKLSSDYVVDPRMLPAQSAYILPRQQNEYIPPHKRQRTASASSPSSAPTSTPTAAQTKVTLKPFPKPPHASIPATFPLTLPGAPSRTSVYDIKAAAGRRCGYDPAKVKLLWQKKPVGDSKTVDELAGPAAEQTPEFGVMFTGQPTAEPDASAGQGDGRQVPGKEAASHRGKDEVMADVGDVEKEDPVKVQARENEVLESKLFWDELREFLVQRIAKGEGRETGEKLAEEVHRVFREAWRTQIQKR